MVKSKQKTDMRLESSDCTFLWYICLCFLNIIIRFRFIPIKFYPVDFSPLFLLFEPFQNLDSVSCHINFPSRLRSPENMISIPPLSVSAMKIKMFHRTRPNTLVELFFFLFFFLWLHLRHREVPGLGTESELLAYTTATTRWDPSRDCDLYLGSRGKPAPLTHWVRPGIEPASSWIQVGFLTCWATAGTPQVFL